MQTVGKHGLQVAPALVDFIEAEALPGSGVSSESFWAGLSALVDTMQPKLDAALARRAELQTQIDAWHKARRAEGLAPDAAAEAAFLREIGYLVPEGPDFEIETANTDPEIATIAGPQLVVPVMNARFALNAANARWGSLYDALYGTDALGRRPSGKGYDPARGAQVIAWAKGFLDTALPLDGANWTDVTGIALDGAALSLTGANGPVALARPAQFLGSRRDAALHLLFENNGLKIELVVDPSSEIGAADPASLSDVRLESAVSAIMDCEDSIAAVDAEDKVAAYANWLGLMKGDLSESFSKGGRTITRRLAEDTAFTGPDGTAFPVKTRALMLVRNVGHLMTTPAVRDGAGREIGEGLLDAMVTVLCALHDLRGPRANSAAGSVYIVKPKMHGPEEVALTDAIFSHVEAVFDLPRSTVKIGIMDEERRTSANLKECIRAARHRVAFINTGFLDRTGDEIHTAMEAGPMLPKGAMKGTDWIAAYEARNVEIGLACGLRGKAQIGKGMWAMPDAMADMLSQKIGHPRSGANCAWVPSPTAATLHATHYHQVSVAERQAEIAAAPAPDRLAALLSIPALDGRTLSAEEIAREVENNCQGILGYVVRWVDQGVGCSKVPDIHDVALMEDRATCRISSQALANWLHHGVISAAQVEAALRKMAAIVDAQNADDPAYWPMAPAFDGPAYAAARALALEGRSQPSGYTEPLLHQWRLTAKAQDHTVAAQ